MTLTRRGHLVTALGVALAAVGCAPPGPRTPQADMEPLRHRMAMPMPPQPQPAGTAAAADTTAPPDTLAVSYLQAGDSSGPQLILVHGTPGSATGWADYLLSPPPGMQVLALDRPGFGRSAPQHAMPRLADQAAAVHALMARDGRPVVLLGHSLGGPVVAQVAADHPGQVTGLVLLAASLDPSLEEVHPMQRVGNWPGVRQLLPRTLRNANDELLALEQELQALSKRLPLITAKVVIVHGTADVLVPVANVPFMQARLQGARCVHTVLLPGSNHFLPWNAEQVVRDAVRDALDPAC